MGSVSNSLSTNPANTPVTVAGSTNSGSFFSGASNYSTDLQNVISRAVAIASMPITQLTNQQTALTNQSTELATLDSKFTDLQTAVQGIATALSGSSFQTNIDQPTVVSATLGDGATEGNYNIDVTDIGAYATSLTAATWDASSKTPTQYTLVVGGQSYSFTPTDDSAASVASAINAQYGNLVQASVVNVGPSSAPDDRIALQAASLGDLQPGIKNAAGTSLQVQQTQGDTATYEVNGSGLSVTSSSRAVTVSPGVTLNLLGTGTANVAVTGSVSALDSALSTFTTAYNAAVTEVVAQRGQAGGVLQGNSVVNSLSQALSQISTYSSSGSAVNGLLSLGLTLGDNGQITYDSGTLMGVDISNSAAVTAFLGSATGGGFLKNATDILTGLVDPTTGLITTTDTALTDQITDIGNQISTKQDQVNQMQTDLTNQMATADAAIASMEQQYSELTSMLQAEQTADQTYATGL